MGENEIEDAHNAVHVAKTPTMDGLKARGPSRYRTVKAHGTAVGLPTDADMGNSEVGHNALGAGKVIAQGASLVDIALETKNVFSDADGATSSPRSRTTPCTSSHFCPTEECTRERIKSLE